MGIHGVGGTIGAILTGVFASTAVNAAGRDGLLCGNPAQLVPQIVGVLVTMVFSFVVSFVILKVIDATIGVRVSRRGRRDRPGPGRPRRNRLRPLDDRECGIYAKTDG